MNYDLDLKQTWWKHTLCTLAYYAEHKIFLKSFLSFERYRGGQEIHSKYVGPFILTLVKQALCASPHYCKNLCQVFFKPFQSFKRYIADKKHSLCLTLTLKQPGWNHSPYGWNMCSAHQPIMLIICAKLFSNLFFFPRDTEQINIQSRIKLQVSTSIDKQYKVNFFLPFFLLSNK